MKKRKFTLFMSLVLVLNIVFGAVSVNAENTLQIASQGACVMDYDTGEILYEYNGDVMRVPASMTKIMNIYCVYEAIENGEISLDTVVPISQNVYEKSRNSVYQSVLPLYTNVEYMVDEIIDIVVVRSASGAAVALAELLGDGSEQVFVDRMNAKAQEMGIDAYYYDSCGIAENKISPKAMATLARNIIADYPDILERSSQSAVTFHGTTYKTTNHLLDTYYYEGADGLKTGSTSAAKYCLCATAVRNGRRIITVTMAAPTVGQSFTDSAKLLDYGFSVASARYKTIYYTDISAYINGEEIPVYAYRTDLEAQTLVSASSLNNYGFDVSYDGASDTLMITYNGDKEITPISAVYNKGRDGQKAFDSVPNTNMIVLINDGADTYEADNVYNVDGHVYIALDEFRDIYDLTWDENSKSVYMETYYKEPKAILPNGEKLTSSSAYIMDYNTGEEIYSFNADVQKPVASIAKMMTVYVILDAIENGEISLDTVVPISENVYNLSRVEDYKMMVNLEYDEEYTVDEMIDMIVIDSAAACVTAMAELISGSEADFVERMNAKAEKIGIDSVFYNGTGVCLDPENENENLMSAEEVAVMTRKMIEDYPEILERTKQASVEFHGNTYYNLNKMFTDYYYEGADGFKNGMTEASGYCTCGTAMLDGRRIITVTLPSDSNEARFTDTAKMFDYAFETLGIDTSETRIKPSETVLSEDDEITINIDGNYEMTFTDQQPVIIDGKVMVPVRELMETLGKTVEWDEETNQTIISDDTIKVKLSAGSEVMIKETTNPLTGITVTEEIELEAAPVVINGRLCLSVGEVVEAFGAAVIWEEADKTILISVGVC